MPTITCPARIRNLLPVLGLLILCLLTFSNGLHNPFMMDDWGLIVTNQGIRDPGFLQLNIFDQTAGHRRGETFAYFRPLTHLLNLVTRELFGPLPFYYHFFNLLIFFAAVCAVFELLSTITKDRTMAFVTSALFATHPFQGMLVNYISASGYPLMILAMAGALLAQVNPPRGKEKAGTAVGLACFTAALLCHEVAIALPLYLAAVLFCAQRYSIGRTLKACLPYVLLAGIYLLFRLHYADIQSSVSAQIKSLELTPGQYLSGYAHLIGLYLKNLIFLQDIVLLRSVDAAHLSVGIGLASLLSGAVLLSTLLWHWGRGLKSLALIWLAIGLLPVVLACGSRPFLGMIIEPHWLNFSTIGFFLIAGILLNRLRRWQGRFPFLTFLILTSALLLTQIAVSRRNNQLWGNEKAYCRYMLELSPGMIIANSWLSYAYMQEKNYPLARFYLKQSLLDAPVDWEVYQNLGAIALEEGQTEDAEHFLLTALRHKGEAAEAHYNLGLLYRMRGENQKSEKHLRLAVHFDYYLVEARILLAKIELEQGRRDEARLLLEENLRIKPRDTFTLDLLKQCQAAPPPDR